MPDVTLLRTAVLVVIALVVGAVLAVFLLYMRAVRLAPRKVGLLPWHVVLVSSGVLVWGAALSWAQIDALSSINEPWHIAARTAMFGVGALLILAALAIVAQVQRRRVRFCHERRAVLVEERDTVEVRNCDEESP